jgi:RNA polymerase sigma factor (sigma-70 family)
VAGSRGVDALVGLTQRAARGDSGALGLLLEALYPRVRLFYRRWIYERADHDETAQDLTQEALIRIAERVGTCRAEADGQVVEWAFAVARRVGVDHLRALRAEWPGRRARVQPDALPAPDATYASEGLRLVSELVAAAYSREPRRVQDVLWLRLAELCTWEEVGAAVGSSAAGAKRIFQRAQRRLRRASLAAAESLPPCERRTVHAWLSGSRARPMVGAP